MTRKQGNILAAVLLTFGLAAVIVPLLMTLPWVLFPLRDYPPLRYPDGVTFYQHSTGQYRSVAWSADDWDHPTPCPLTVHLPTVTWTRLICRLSTGSGARNGRRSPRAPALMCSSRAGSLNATSATGH